MAGQFNNNTGRPPMRPLFNNFTQMRPYQTAPQLFRPSAQKPKPRPGTINKQINYINRPQFETGKRPPMPINAYDAAKRQRNFNIQTNSKDSRETEETVLTIDNIEQMVAAHDEQIQYEDTLEKYANAINEVDKEPHYDYPYLNF